MGDGLWPPGLHVTSLDGEPWWVRLALRLKRVHSVALDTTGAARVYYKIFGRRIFIVEEPRRGL